MVAKRAGKSKPPGREPVLRQMSLQWNNSACANPQSVASRKGVWRLARIDPAIDDAEKLTKLLTTFPSAKIEGYAVDPMVGSVRKNSANCVKPI